MPVEIDQARDKLEPHWIANRPENMDRILEKGEAF